MERIERKEYLDWLLNWRERQIIKVVSGVRRCGKSTLLAIYRDWLLQNGVEPQQIIAINFENIEYEHLTGYRVLYDHIKSLLLPGRMNYILLDEIQHVEHFEKTVDSLFIQENCDVYITGSNAYFMSGELATLLSGRYVELKMLPLSFQEFCFGLDAVGLQRREKFDAYLRYGSFPYTLRLPEDGPEVRQYLTDLYNTVLLKDIVARLRISDVTSLEQVTKFLLHNIGNRVSPGKIANALKSAGRGVDQKTVDKYIRGLTDSLLIYEASRYNIKGRQYLSTQSKYYVVDVALQNTLVRGSDSDIGHILENIVYLELLRRANRVFVGELEDGEVDFVVEDQNGLQYFQVAATVPDESVLARELDPLQKIQDNYPKFLLTLDDVFATVDYGGIKKVNVLDWLLEVSQ